MPARGVIAVVRAGSDPCIIPNEVVAELKRELAPSRIRTAPTIPPREERSIINGPPLAALLALMAALGGPRCRAWAQRAMVAEWEISTSF